MKLTLSVKRIISIFKTLETGDCCDNIHTMFVTHKLATQSANIFSRLSSNSEANASELPESLE